jgi:Fe-S cluster assembly iron-binding protein IscA
LNKKQYQELKNKIANLEVFYLSIINQISLSSLFLNNIIITFVNSIKKSKFIIKSMNIRITIHEKLLNDV